MSPLDWTAYLPGSNNTWLGGEPPDTATVIIKGRDDFPDNVIAWINDHGSITTEEQDEYAALFAAAPSLLKYAQQALDQITNDREEECWCYDECDGAPDSPPPGKCLACHLREAIREACPEGETK